MVNTSLAAKGALANRLQRRTACKIQNGSQGAPKWQRGSEMVSTLRFLGVPVNFRKIGFLIRALLLWEKVTTEEKNRGGAGKKEENNDVYTNIVASWLPEHQPTGKRTSCANYKDSFDTETTTANKSMGFDHSAINLVCD